MKFVRFEQHLKGSDKRIGWGITKGDHIEIMDGTPFDEWQKTSEKVKVYEVRFLAPCNPTKIVCVGLNYMDHAQELNMEIPDEPVLFLKPPSSLLDPEGFIVKPESSRKLDYEAELAVVIAKQAKNVSPEEIPNYILGYTCFNDVTARDIQRKDKQWSRAKSFDTFAPIGPTIVANIDPNRLNIELILNDKVRQSSNTSHMLFKVEKLVSFVSRVMTLMPGDIVATGTPAGVGDMKPGDVVEVSIEKIGALRNYVTDERE